MPDAKVDFYGHHSIDEVRLVYRRLAMVLRDEPVRREAALAATITELNGPSDELRKFKFSLPDFLRRVLTPAEVAQFAAGTAGRRAHNGRLKMVLPRVSDEFSLDPEFLDAVLDLEAGPGVPAAGRFFTIGSCFARNITQFLVARGCDAQTYELAEDLNSPISNAFLFDLLRKPQAERLAVLMYWLGRIFPGVNEAELTKVAHRQLAGVDKLTGQIRDADCVIMTLGNVVDFFRDDADAGQPLMDKIFPKFVAMAAAGDLGPNANAASRMKKQGASLRLATHQETCEAIAACIAGVRSVTSAPIVITLSPVPVDSVIGLAGTARSAIEVDCISKSRLRSALDEITPALRLEQGPIHYFPSFEIVRWIAPMLSAPAFGLEDAAARHVSAPILAAVCGLFLDRFVKWAPAQTAATAAASA